MPEKGYKYEYLSRTQREGAKKQGEGQRGLPKLNGPAIAETFLKMDPKALSAFRKKAWSNRPRRWIVTDVITKEAYKSSNLSQFCKWMDIGETQLNRIASFHAGKVIGGSRLYLGRYDCWNEDTKISRKTEYDTKYRIVDRISGETWYIESLGPFGEVFGIPLSNLHYSLKSTCKSGDNYKIRKNSPRFLVYSNETRKDTK